MKNPIPLLVLMGLASCGGQAVVPSGDSGTSGRDGYVTDGPPNDEFAQDTGAPTDARPPVDSPECNIQEESGNVECVLCSDGNWHCGLDVLPPCPTDIRQGSSCSTPDKSCFACNAGGNGDEYTCSLKALIWGSPNPIACMR
jgi:hypothetical protein